PGTKPFNRPVPRPLGPRSARSTVYVNAATILHTTNGALFLTRNDPPLSRLIQLRSFGMPLLRCGHPSRTNYSMPRYRRLGVLLAHHVQHSLEYQDLDYPS